MVMTLSKRQPCGDAAKHRKKKQRTNLIRESHFGSVGDRLERYGIALNEIIHASNDGSCFFESIYETQQHVRHTEPFLNKKTKKTPAKGVSLPVTNVSFQQLRQLGFQFSLSFEHINYRLAFGEQMELRVFQWDDLAAGQGGLKLFDVS